jgi:D-3-phosphoglycerate dehydrogenase / 2-oxoglutarate reductase
MKIVVLDSLFDSLDIEGEAAAAKGATIERWSGDPGSLGVADVVAHVRTPVDGALIASMKRCRVITRFGTGTDTVDLDAAEAAGITVVTVRDYCIPELCTHTLGLAFTLTRRLRETTDNLDASWRTVAATAPLSRHARAAVVGMGTIGSRIAAALKALDHEVVVVTGAADRAEVAGVPTVTLEDALEFADLVFLHCALDTRTRGLIDDRRLALLRPTSILIDTARVGLLDEEAVARALEQQRLGGLGLDGHLAADSPLRRLGDDPRLLVTPHVGWYSDQSATALRRAAILNALERVREHDHRPAHDRARA